MNMLNIALVSVCLVSSAYSQGEGAIEGLADLLLAVAPVSSPRAASTSCSQRYSDPQMIRACRRGYVPYQKPKEERLSGYAVTLEAVARTLENTEVMFCMQSEGLTVQQRDALTASLPETITATVVKNKLLNIALKAPEFANLKPASEMTKGCNLWFFVKFEDMRATYDAHKEWLKTSGVDRKVYVIKGGAFDGQLLDTDGVEAVSKLPTKQELMGTVAFLIKQIPTKLARGIKEVPTKLARGIDMAVEEGKEQGVDLLKDVTPKESVEA